MHRALNRSGGLPLDEFKPEIYSQPIAELLVFDRLCELGPGEPVERLRPKLARLTVQSLAGEQRLVDEQMAAACLAGLWLRFDFLDESHRISQELETATGSYWHGIMHRREPDDSNARYWFRRVGRHPVFEPLAAEAARLAQTAALDRTSQWLAAGGPWDPLAFVELCSEARRGKSRLEPLCRQIQQREWELLFDFCWQAAVE